MQSLHIFSSWNYQNLEIEPQLFIMLVVIRAGCLGEWSPHMGLYRLKSTSYFVVLL